MFAAVRGGQSLFGVLADAEQLRNLARATNSTVEELSRLRGAFRIAGLDAATFESNINTLGSAVSAALRDREGREFDAFRQLGITLEDLRTSNYEQLFEQIASGVERFDSAAERATIIESIFTEDFQRLFPLIGRGAGAFRALADAAERYGATLSGNVAISAAVVSRSTRELGIAFSSVFRDAVIAVAEELEPLIRTFSEFIRNNRELVSSRIADVLRTIARAFSTIAGEVLKLVAALGDFQRSFSKTLTDLERTSPPFGGLVSSIADSFGFNKLNEDALAAREAVRRLADVIVRLRERDDAESQATLTTRTEQFRVAVQRVVDQTGEGFDQVAQRALDTSSTFFLGAQLAAGRVPRGATDQGGSTVVGVDGNQASSSPRTQLDTQVEDILTEEVRLTTAINAVEEGFQQALVSFGSFRDNVLEGAQRIGDQALDGVANALTSIILQTQSAEEAFRNLAKSLLEEIARLIPRLLILRALQATIGGLLGGDNQTSTTTTVAQAQGGIIAGARLSNNRPASFRAFQDGGVATGPTLALFGEGGGPGEAFVPLNGNRRIPVQLAGGGGSMVFQFNITAPDTGGVRKLLIDNHETLMSIWMNRVRRVGGFRSTIKELS